MPSLKDSILLLEDDYEVYPEMFDRTLQSLIHQPEFKGVKALMIGRFQRASEMSKETLIKIIESKKELKYIPVIFDMDFGHTTPRFTFPVGGHATIKCTGSKVKLLIGDNYTKE